MAALSNFFRPRDAAAAPVYRPVQRGEIESALRLILGTSRANAGDEQVLDFLSFALSRGIDVNQTWVAEVGGRIEWALLPIVSPGRTMLLFTPSRLPRTQYRHVIGELNERVLAAAAAPVAALLCQILIDPAERAVIDAYLACRYEILAELAYLQANVSGREPLPALPPGWTMHQYDETTHALFAQTIGASYEQSLDCPALNGRRDIEDILAGHKAAGDFDPKLWFLLTENDRPLGSLLLSRTAGNGQVELVYIGLVPEARGRGAGDFLIDWAIAVVGLENRKYLSLAVDARNDPALRLYYRHGFSRVGSRVALLRDLRANPPIVPAEPAATDASTVMDAPPANR
jgi:ribosomal protein S18 acetylase RimI-like enzyme